MGAGMLPIAIGVGVDPSFRSPMAIVVIGGLITSTFLSLLIIPVIFTYVDDVVQKIQGWLHRKKPAAAPAGGGAATPGPADRH
jgi:amino acid transporter